MKIIVLDIDHTVSDSFWRDHLIPTPGEPGEWDDYHHGLINDKPLPDIVDMLSVLCKCYYIMAVTARPEKWRKASMDWMIKNGVKIDELLMRPENDFRRAPELKLSLVEAAIKKQHNGDWRKHIAFALDDREDIVAAFRAAGITAMQVFAKKGAPQ